jgi:uncharacterized membrane protein YhaH (DUF805 family)
MLSTTVFSLALSIVTVMLVSYYQAQQANLIVSSAFGAHILLPTLAVIARRTHDIGQPGWKALTSFGWLVREGDTDANQYGTNPKG